MLDDKKIRWTHHRLFRNVQQFASQFALSLTEGAPNTVTIDNAATAAVTLAEVGTTGIVGLKLAAAGNIVRDAIPVDPTWNLRKPLYVRVHYTTGSSTSADTIDWIVTYKEIAAGAAIAAADTALSTAVAQDTVGGTANAFLATTWGVLNGATLTLGTAGGRSTLSWLVIDIEMDALAAGLAEDVFLLGYEMYFHPALCQGRGNETRFADTYDILAPTDA